MLKIETLLEHTTEPRGDAKPEHYRVVHVPQGLTAVDCVTQAKKPGPILCVHIAGEDRWIETRELAVAALEEANAPEGFIEQVSLLAGVPGAPLPEPEDADDDEDEAPETVVVLDSDDPEVPVLGPFDSVADAESAKAAHDLELHHVGEASADAEMFSLDEYLELIEEDDDKE